MSNRKVFSIEVSLVIALLLTSLNQADNVEKSLIFELATNYQNLGKTEMCLADYFDDAALQTKVSEIIHGGLGFLKQNIGKTLSGAEYLNLSNNAVRTATDLMLGLNEECSKIPKKYTPTNTPPEGLQMSKAAQVILKVGEILECVAKKGDIEELEKIPMFYGKEIHGLAMDTGDTYADILYRHETTLASDLAGLTTECSVLTK